MTITPQKAKEIMDTQEGYVILDVRTPAEYEAGHIPGAVLLPDDEITLCAEDELPDQDQLILVYCRSGVRSVGAAMQLEMLGYTHVLDFGGILSWPYEIVTD